jgi:hypothetical protein
MLYSNIVLAEAMAVNERTHLIIRLKNLNNAVVRPPAVQHNIRFVSKIQVHVVLCIISIEASTSESK